MSLAPAELILNPDGSIYHLNLIPDDIASTILLVGDPERVSEVSKYFDRIEIKKSKREFLTHTGTIGSLQLSVISTGIGTDNIDIVLNELDALVNLDLGTRVPKNDFTRLRFIRIGTSGSIQPEIAPDNILLSEMGLGLDGLLHYYNSENVRRLSVEQEFCNKTHLSESLAKPYAVMANSALNTVLKSEQTFLGITATLPGFYAPQGRSLRLLPKIENFIDQLSKFETEGLKITNMEMETAGIFGLSALLGHSAASLNCILANRNHGTFSENPAKSVDLMIRYTLEKLTTTS